MMILEGEERFTVRGSQVSSVQQNKTIGEAKQAFGNVLISGLPSSESGSGIDNGEWFMREHGEYGFGLRPLGEYANNNDFEEEKQRIDSENVPSEGLKLNVFWAQSV